MAQDDFVSHSSKNKATADAVCHALDGGGVQPMPAPEPVSIAPLPAPESVSIAPMSAPEAISIAPMAAPEAISIAPRHIEIAGEKIEADE
jgi:hypothetical protein